MHIARIHKMLETLSEWAECEIDKGKECVCTAEMGQVIDMIKDLSEAEKDCYEAKYNKEIYDSMKDTECRSGYDHWRYSSGRFAPTGHGHRSGYIPYVDPWMMDGIPEEYRMGYDEDRISRMDGDNEKVGYGGRYSDRSRGMSRGSRMGYDDSMMDWYNQYKDHKRHYTETHNPEDKIKMDESAKHHMEESMDTMKEIWKDADPNLRKKMREDLAKLINEMPA